MLFLLQDITLADNIQLPLISLAGGIGLLVVFVFFTLRLVSQVSKIQTELNRVYSRLRPLLSSASESSAPEIDEERLRKLTELLEHPRLLRNAWGRYRRTLVVDRARWYETPRVFATVNAAEVFTVEALFSSLNLTFYRSFPAMLTGVGLLLTFVAFFIGLSKIQFVGTTISGLPGLINGLSGKFLTSIVGMFCAVIFAALEKVLLHRLLSAYHATVDRLDELFALRSTSDFLFELTQSQGENGRLLKYLGLDLAQHFRKSLTESMGTPVAELTTAVRRLRAADPADVLADRAQRNPQDPPNRSGSHVNNVQDWGHLSGAFERLEAGAIRQEQLLARLADILLPWTEIPTTSRSTNGATMRGSTALTAIVTEVTSTA
jgi:hypothetical protein